MISSRCFVLFCFIIFQRLANMASSQEANLNSITVEDGGATDAIVDKLKEEYKDWLYPPGVQLKFNFTK